MNSTLRDWATDQWLPQPRFAKTPGYAMVRVVSLTIIGLLFTIVGLLGAVAVISGSIGTTRETGIVRAVEVPRNGDANSLRVAVPKRNTLVLVSTDSNDARDYPVGSRVTILVDHNPNEAAVDDVASQLVGSGLTFLAGLVPLGFAAAWRSRRRDLLAERED
ncbi:hypothetical protein [Oryzihumus leptocrescens]|uniref:hypothetical protein n=1 Tax=Oryzihumus leptocrescens TaxID=297536 RepID=UPI00114FB54D|nr:hypothetical protein [Oryzihumus leptocrescens]